MPRLCPTARNRCATASPHSWRDRTAHFIWCWDSTGKVTTSHENHVDTITDCEPAIGRTSYDTCQLPGNRQLNCIAY